MIRVADVICQTMQKQLKEIKAMLRVRALQLHLCNCSRQSSVASLQSPREDGVRT